MPKERANRLTNKSTLAERSAFSFAQVRRLAVVIDKKTGLEVTNPKTGKDVIDPNTGEVKICADLMSAYDGPAFFNDPYVEAKGHDLDPENFVNAYIANINPAVRYSMLKQALESLGNVEGEPVAIPDPQLVLDMQESKKRQTGSIASACEVFQILAGPSPYEIEQRCIKTGDAFFPYSPYQYARKDYETFSKHKKMIASMFHGTNIIFPCGGDGEKLAHILREMATLGLAPNAIICNDTEKHSLEEMCKKLAATTGHMTFDGKTCSIPVIGIQGDWMSEKTYESKNIKSANIYNGGGSQDFVQSVSKQGLFAALREDPHPTSFFMGGVNFNNFESDEFLTFLKNFREDTLNLVSVDHTVDPATLYENYISHPIVRQMVLTGITHACWGNLKGKEGQFDPRFIGVKIEVIPWGENVNLQISLYEKMNPENKVDITPIVKMKFHIFGKLLVEHNMQILGSFNPTDTQEKSGSTLATLVAFCHKDKVQELSSRALRNNKSLDSSVVRAKGLSPI